MPRLPRLALGSLQPLADPQPLSWAVMDALTRSGWQVQHFLSTARFAPCDAAHPITGLASRQVDSWLMPASVCRELFSHGARGCDAAIVEGRFPSPVTAASCRRRVHSAADDDFSPLESQRVPRPSTGSCFATLCDWLDLPRIAVVDVAQLANCRLPERPDRLSGLLLDRFSDERDYRRWQTLLEPLWGVPVLGGLPLAPRLRQAIAELPRGAELPRRLCQDLGGLFCEYAEIASLRALAESRDFSPPPARLFRSGLAVRPLRVAVAYDAAFRCYYPDTLDLLEARGAELIDFSPLRDEGLPPDVDVVYLGCGHPERFAAQLSGNYCLTSALRNHVCDGRRIYAEGGGLAYLCSQIAWPDGRRAPMSGVLPAVAHFHPQAPPAHPAEITLAAGNWLGPAGARLRGYINNHWTLTAGGELSTLAAGPGESCHVVGRHHAIGSRLHLNFAVQPELFQGFFRPHAACLELARSGAGSSR